MQTLDSTASGGRHSSWSGKVLATMEAHVELNKRLSAQQTKALMDELAILQKKKANLDEAYGNYHRFNEHAFVGISAKQRVANYLCDVALEEERGQLIGRKRDAEQAVPGIMTRFLEMPLSRALNAGHELTVEVLRRAADALTLLPDDRFAFANTAEANLRHASDRLHEMNLARRKLEEEQRAPLKLAVDRAILELREAIAQMNGRLRTHFDDRFIDSLYPELDPKGRASAEDDDAPPAPAPAPTA